MAGPAAEHLDASILNCLQQALIVVNTGGTITRSNTAAAELSGLSLGELVGSQLRDLPFTIRDRSGHPLEPTHSPIHRALEPAQRARRPALRRDEHVRPT